MNHQLDNEYYVAFAWIKIESSFNVEETSSTQMNSKCRYQLSLLSLLY